MNAQGDRQVKFPISHDPAQKIVRVGGDAFASPDLARRREWDYTIKEQICGWPSPKKSEAVDFSDFPSGGLPSTKDLNKWFYEHLGPRFNYRFQAAMYHTWISPHISKPVANMLRHGGKHWREYDNALVVRAHECLDHVRQAERDGLLHLVPIILLFSADPQSIKSELGGALWRRLAHNSKTRNWLLMRTAIGADQLSRPEAIERLIDIRSGILPSIANVDALECIAARLSPRVKRPDFMQTFHMVRDTKRMLQADFNPDWSLRRMSKEHDKAVAERNRKKYSTQPFAAPWSFEADGYTATLLVSPLEIANEGMTQHHCLASYANSARDGHYAAFRIEGRERASLGVRVRKSVSDIDQCYGACNSPVSQRAAGFARLCHERYRQERVLSR